MFRLFLCMLILLFGSASKADVFLTVNPSTQTGRVGSPLVFDLAISGLSGGTSGTIGAIDLDIFFDDSVLNFESVVFGDQLDVFGLGDIRSVTQPVSSIVNILEVSLDSANDISNHQSRSFSIATLSFSGFGVGNSPVSLTINALADADGNPLSAKIINGIATVASVPEPATLSLFLFGLLTFVLARPKVLRGLAPTLIYSARRQV